jgi:DNA-binding transcriptional ArsR family regulator
MTRWLYENPIPIAVLLGAIAVVLVFRALSSGERREFLAAGITVALALGALAVGKWVVTPGEEARAVAEELVEHAESAEVDAAAALFTDNAVLNYGRRESQGLSIQAIRRALESLAAANRIEANRVTRLVYRTLDDTTGEVELSCSTTTARSGMTVPTNWIVRVRRTGAGPDTRWRIDRLTFESLFGKAPPQNLW